jgi:type II secretory pathway pseudopilin PulG
MIEILVVVMIMIVLVAILIPVLSGVSDEAKAVAAKQTMTTIKTAINAYHSDFGDYPPSRIYDTSNNRRTFGAPNRVLSVNGSHRFQGAELLAQALVGPMPEGDRNNPDNSSAVDHQDGYGWVGSDRKANKAYGPYLALGTGDNILAPRFDANGDSIVNNGEYKNDLTGSWSDHPLYSGQTQPKPGAFVLTTPGSDTRRPILYYHPISPRGRRVWTGDIHDSDGESVIGYGDDSDTSPTPRFDLNHNKEGLLIMLDHDDMDGEDELEDPLEFWRSVRDSPAVSESGVGDETMRLEAVHPQWLQQRQQFERSLRSADYLLLSAGPDDVFGLEDEYKPGSLGYKNQLKESDDIYVTGP